MIVMPSSSVTDELFFSLEKDSFDLIFKAGYFSDLKYSVIARSVPFPPITASPFNAESVL